MKFTELGLSEPLLRAIADQGYDTPTGGLVTLTATAGKTGPLLTVDDNGPGIDPTERDRVFERFVRGGAAADATGSGLGLAIVRGIARRHGATVSLDESPLGGLRVSLQFAEQAPAALG